MTAELLFESLQALEDKQKANFYMDFSKKAKDNAEGNFFNSRKLFIRQIA
jgi:hypothetical protein